MIYLIRSTWFKRDTGNIVDLLKIGYTDENSLEQRLGHYKHHNPLCELLYVIPGGSERDEKNLHCYFNKFKYSEYGREWFEYNIKIIEYFESHKTKESLQDLVGILAGDYKISPEFYKVIKKIANRWLCIDTRPEVDLNEVIKFFHDNYRRYYTKELIYKYLIDTYNVDENTIKAIDDFIEGKLDNSEKITTFLEDFNILSDFPSKMKFLCEAKLNNNERLIILDQIPLTYKNYYLTLGPERCKARSYNKTRIEQEYKDSMFDIHQLVNEIYSIFKVGSRHTKANIKSALADLYSNLGYNKTPKASDLEEYFEMKLCKVGPDNGFEILSKKGDSI